MGFRVLGIMVQSTLIARDCLRKLALMRYRVGQMIMGVRQRRVEPQRLPKMADRLVFSAGCLEKGSQVGVGMCMRSLDCQNMAIKPFGMSKLTAPMMLYGPLQDMCDGVHTRLRKEKLRPKAYPRPAAK